MWTKTIATWSLHFPRIRQYACVCCCFFFLVFLSFLWYFPMLRSVVRTTLVLVLQNLIEKGFTEWATELFYFLTPQFSFYRRWWDSLRFCPWWEKMWHINCNMVKLKRQWTCWRNCISMSNLTYFLQRSGKEIGQEPLHIVPGNEENFALCSRRKYQLG